jgi:hypothetical protein
MDSPRPGAQSAAGPISRYVGEVVALVVLMYCVMALCTEMLGVRDPVSVVAIVVACVSHPARRLLEGDRPRPAEKQDCGVAAILAMAPWMVVGCLHELYPDWAVWQPVDIPAASRYLGTAAAIGLVLARPALGRGSASGATVPKLDMQNALMMISLLLMSWSGVVAGLTMCWLAALAVQRLMPRTDTIADRIAWAFASLRASA